MRLEDLVYEHLKNQPDITGLLTKFQDEPAIFYGKSPDDNTDGWDRQMPYPRIEFLIDMQADRKRKNDGRMKMYILCEESGVLPDEIEILIKGALKDLFIQPEDMAPVCMAWLKTKSFISTELATMGKTRLAGLQVFFDIFEYPGQASTDPGPVMACASFITEKYPECVNVGIDRIDRFFRTNTKVPAVYFRLMEIKRESETNTVVWLDGKIAVHVFAPEQEVRMQWISEFLSRVILYGGLTMPDDSPMRIKGITVNHEADYVSQGQIVMEVQYGLLRYQAKSHPVTTANINLR